MAAKGISIIAVERGKERQRDREGRQVAQNLLACLSVSLCCVEIAQGGEFGFNAILLQL